MISPPTTAGLAVFDFDGTLRRGDSFLPFVVSIVGPRQAARVLFRAGWYSRRRGEFRDHLKAAVVRSVFAGMTKDELAEHGREFGGTLLEDLRTDVVDRLYWHCEAGVRTAIVSASLSAYLRPVADHLGVDLLATDLAADEAGMLTGAITGANCRGAEKVRRIEQRYPHLSGTTWAYGDSAGDAEMLAWSTYPVRVTRHPLPSRPRSESAER